MEVIVADANIFVYFHICNLLTKFLSCKNYRVKIAEAVYLEITDKNKRISREYPELRQIILNSSNNHSSGTSFQRININEHIHNLNAIKIYYELKENGELDLGEIESIPLSIELNARFLSNDLDAIAIANVIQSGLAITFLDFCFELFKNEIISQKELSTIQKFLDNY